MPVVDFERKAVDGGGVDATGDVLFFPLHYFLVVLGSFFG